MRKTVYSSVGVAAEDGKRRRVTPLMAPAMCEKRANAYTDDRRKRTLKPSGRCAADYYADLRRRRGW